MVHYAYLLLSISCVCSGHLFAAGFSPSSSRQHPFEFSRRRQVHGQRRVVVTPSSSLRVLNGEKLKEEETKQQGPVSKTFFDVEEEHEGEVCFISDPDMTKRSSVFATDTDTGDDEQRFWITVHRVVRLIPIVAPIVAYFSYEELASSVNVIEDFLDSQRAWIAVDGGAYQAKIIAPAVNGVVVPSISILFATLISNTVSSLRQRILDIREAINMEAGDLRVLTTLVDAYPPGFEQDKCRSYLIQYTSRLIAESRPGVKINTLEPTGMDSEMYGLLGQLNELSAPAHSTEVTPTVLAESYGAVMRLNNERCRRISALQSTYPSLHFAIVSMLAVSICVAFLMETNQELLIFLNSIQLRILWTMLIGTFSALGVVCYDLCDAFAGSNKLSKSVNQLYTIRSALRASVCLEE